MHPRDVSTAIKTAFPDKATSSLSTLLDQYGTESYQNEKERVQLAIMALSGGIEDKLPSLVQSAKTDYRNILARQPLGPLWKTEG
jgi:hypothetical protein